MKISDLGGTKKLLGRRRALLAMVAAVALLLVPAPALAQQISPTSDQYDPRTTIVSEGPGEPGEPSSSDRAAGDLPFTGLDVALLIAAAGLLGGAGLVLRRVSASHRS
jgi:hypothetical protein